MSRLIDKTVLEGQKILKESESPVNLDEEDLHQYANYLGINISEERDLLWIAAKGLSSPLPLGWIPVEDEKGRIYYFNSEENSSSWSHPADLECKRLLKQARDDPLSLSEENTLFQYYMKNERKDSGLDMSSFQKKSFSLSEKRSVRFDLSSKTEEISIESETGSETDMDDLVDKFGLLDAGNLSPAFIRSPEPEDVNSLLRITSLENTMKPINRSLGNTTSPLPSMDVSGDKRMNFLKPLSPIGKLPSQTTKNDNPLPKAKESIKNIDVIADPLLSTMSYPEARALSSSPLTPSMPQALGKVTLNKMAPLPSPVSPKPTVTITKTPPEKFHLSDEELKIKVDHEMALIDLRNKFEDERELEEEKYHEELDELKNNSKDALAQEKAKLEIELQNNIKLFKNELESKKKEEIKTLESQKDADIEKVLENIKSGISKDHEKEVETLKESLSKKHKEDLNQLKIKLESEHEKAKEGVQKDYASKKTELKAQQEKETIDTKKIYAVDLAKMKLDLEKDLQRKLGELKKEHETSLKSLETELQKSKSEAGKDLQKKLDDWKIGEEAKLINNELSTLNEKVKSQKEELESENKKLAELNDKKKKLEEEVIKLESNIEVLRQQTNVMSSPPTVDSKNTQPVTQSQNRNVETSGDNIEYLHQKVLHIDTYLESFNEQLQSLSQIVQASRQFETPLRAPTLAPNPDDISSSSSVLNDNTYTRQVENYPPIAQDEFSDLKDLLKSCKRKLRSLERKRFEVHGYEAFDMGQSRRMPYKFNSSYNSYWNKNMARKNATVKKAQRFLGVNSHKPKKLSHMYRYDQESSALARMAEKLTKKLDHEAKELSRMESKLKQSCPMGSNNNEARHSRVISQLENSDSSSSSLSSSPNSTPYEMESTVYRNIRDHNPSSYQPYTPYVPLTIQLKQHQELHSQVLSARHKDGPDDVENKIKQAWTDCFGDKTAPVISRNYNQQLTSDVLRTDHAKWMEKIETMNRKIRQTDSKQKDKF